MDLKTVTTEALMRELITRSVQTPAPYTRKIFDPCSEWMFPIGKDHTATLTIFDDGLAVLETL